MKRTVNWKDFLSIYGPGLVLVIAGFYFAQNFIKPAPPKEVTIAAGQPTGAYYKFAEQYAAFLQKEGIQLNIRETAGSIENFSMLQNAEVDIAFIQGGTIPTENPGKLEGLGSIYFEPLWLFHRKGYPLGRLGQLQDRKVSIGLEGSGTFALVSRLLEENKLDVDGKVERVYLADSDAMVALRSGKIDAAFFVTQPESSLIDELMTDDEILVTSFDRAAGYAKRFYYLSALSLPEGALDLEKNIPDRDIELISPTASLAVHPDLHPAIVDLIMQAASESHHSPGLLAENGQFPTPKYLELPLNSQADRYYKHGPPFLQRYLPFWAASMIDRLKVMLLPLMVLMIPIFKIMPPLYQWRMRSRILKMYNRLEALDHRGKDIMEMPQSDRRKIKSELDKLYQDAQDLKVPISFSDRLYSLRQHIALVRQHVTQWDD